MTQPNPGWYPDPADPSRQRYFDGRVWTDHYASYGPPPPYPANLASPPAKTQWNWKWISGIGAVALVLIVIASIDDSDDKQSTTAAERSSAATPTKTWSPTGVKPSGPSLAPAGSSVRDGKFEFQVLGVERGASSLDDAFGPEVAKGEFFTVKLRVTNIGDEARSFSATNQKLIVNGKEYEATSIMDNGWMEDINPGLSIDTQASFDIPPGAVPTAIECHDSIFSGGARLAL